MRAGILWASEIRNRPQNIGPELSIIVWGVASPASIAMAALKILKVEPSS